jgi:hypothetical protein
MKLGKEVGDMKALVVKLGFRKGLGFGGEGGGRAHRLTSLPEDNSARTAL